MTDPVEPANLRFLRRLVSTLTATMLVGLVVVVGLLVTRLRVKAPELPFSITLPDGARANAVTMGDTWYAIVTDGDQILIYDRMSGALKQTVTLDQ